MIVQINAGGGNPIDIDTSQGKHGLNPGDVVNIFHVVRDGHGSIKEKRLIKNHVEVVGVGDWPMGGVPKLWVKEGPKTYTYVDRAEEVELVKKDDSSDQRSVDHPV